MHPNHKITRFISFLLMALAVKAFATENQVSTKEANPFKQTMWYFTEMRLNQATSNDILFFGDSLVQGMNTSDLKAKPVNMGIGGYSIKEITNRIKAIKIEQYRAVIIEGGVNDILIDKDDQEIKLEFNNLFREAAKAKRFYYTQMLPVQNKEFSKTNNKIKFFNEYTAKVCALFSNCTIVPSPVVMWENATLDYYFPDGIHLRKKGYATWKSEINKKIKPQCSFIPDNIRLWDWLDSHLPCSNY